MKPTMNRVLLKVEVEVLKEGETTKGNTVMTADVIDVGPDVKAIKKGGKVMFAPYGFDEIALDGEKYVVISEELILTASK